MSFVRYGLRLFTNKPSTVGYLVRFGSRFKTETENNVFLLQFGKRFSLKNSVQIAEMVGSEKVRFGRVR